MTNFLLSGALLQAPLIRRIVTGSLLALMLYPQNSALASEQVTSPTSGTVAANSQSSAPFELRGDTVFIPNWDDVPPEDTHQLLELSSEAFETSSTDKWSRFVVLGYRDAHSKAFELPEGANEIEIVAKGNTVEHLWPDIEVQLEPEEPGTARFTVFRGYIQSRSLEPFRSPLPAGLKPGQVRMHVRLVNPSTSLALRYAHILKITFRKKPSAL